MAGERTLPGLGLNAFWTLGSNGYKDQMDENLRVLSALVQARVESFVPFAPGSPTDGDMHIINAGVNINKVAIRDNGAWIYYVPNEGWIFWVDTEARHYMFNGSIWEPLTGSSSVSGKPWELIVACGDESTPAEVGSSVVTFRLPRGITLTSVTANVTTAPTGSPLELDVNKNGTSIFSTGLTIDATDTTSVGASTPAVLSTTVFSADDRVTVDVVAVGSTFKGAGIKINFAGVYT